MLSKNSVIELPVIKPKTLIRNNLYFQADTYNFKWSVVHKIEIFYGPTMTHSQRKNAEPN